MDGRMPRERAVGVLPALGPGRCIALLALAWVAFLSVDFLFHAGILARFYLRGDPALLGADAAFRRIPLGYLAFLLITLLLMWLARRCAVFGWRAGMRFGFGFGALLGFAQSLALFSILRLGAPLLIGWAAAQTVEAAAAGAVVGAGNAGAPLRRIAIVVAALLAAAIVLTVAMQATGLAPPMRQTGGAS